jgi:hypothetical protein
MLLANSALFPVTPYPLLAFRRIFNRVKRIYILIYMIFRYFTILKDEMLGSWEAVNKDVC